MTSRSSAIVISSKKLPIASSQYVLTSHLAIIVFEKPFLPLYEQKSSVILVKVLITISSIVIALFFNSIIAT